jgi:hypothetical protein
MRTSSLATVGLTALLLSSTALGQQWGGQWSTGGGGQTWGQPVAMPRVRKLDNVGRAGQVVFGVDRITGLGFNHSVDRKKTTTVGVTGNLKSRGVDTYTELALFGASAGRDQDLQGGPRNPGLLPRLALDYVPIEGLTLGTSFMVLHESGESRYQVTSAGLPANATRAEPASTLLLVHPRIGFAWPFDDTFGLWPRVGLAWSHTNSTVERPVPMGREQLESRYDVLSLTLEAMVVVSPYKHFALLLGPYADVGLGGKGETTTSIQGSSGAYAPTDTITHRILANSFGLAGGLVAYFP